MQRARLDSVETKHRRRRRPDARFFWKVKVQGRETEKRAPEIGGEKYRRSKMQERQALPKRESPTFTVIQQMKEQDVPILPLWAEETRQKIQEILLGIQKEAKYQRYKPYETSIDSTEKTRRKKQEVKPECGICLTNAPLYTRSRCQNHGMCLKCLKRMEWDKCPYCRSAPPKKWCDYLNPKDGTRKSLAVRDVVADWLRNKEKSPYAPWFVMRSEQ